MQGRIKILKDVDKSNILPMTHAKAVYTSTEETLDKTLDDIRKGTVKVIEATGAEIEELIKNKALVKGKRYLYKDWRSYYKHQDGSELISEGENEPLILTAIKEDKFYSIAVSTLYPDDVIYFTFDLRLNGSPVRGCILRRIDPGKRISAPSDWKNLKVVVGKISQNNVLTESGVNDITFVASGNPTLELNKVYKKDSDFYLSRGTGSFFETGWYNVSGFIKETKFRNITANSFRFAQMYIETPNSSFVKCYSSEFELDTAFGDSTNIEIDGFKTTPSWYIRGNNNTVGVNSTDIVIIGSGNELGGNLSGVYVSGFSNRVNIGYTLNISGSNNVIMNNTNLVVVGNNNLVKNSFAINLSGDNNEVLGSSISEYIHFKYSSIGSDSRNNKMHNFLYCSLPQNSYNNVFYGRTQYLRCNFISNFNNNKDSNLYRVNNVISSNFTCTGYCFGNDFGIGRVDYCSFKNFAQNSLVDKGLLDSCSGDYITNVEFRTPARDCNFQKFSSKIITESIFDSSQSKVVHQTEGSRYFCFYYDADGYQKRIQLT